MSLSDYYPDASESDIEYLLGIAQESLISAKSCDAVVLHSFTSRSKGRNRRRRSPVYIELVSERQSSSRFYTVTDYPGRGIDCIAQSLGVSAYELLNRLRLENSYKIS